MRPLATASLLASLLALAWGQAGAARCDHVPAKQPAGYGTPPAKPGVRLAKKALTPRLTPTSAAASRAMKGASAAGDCLSADVPVQSLAMRVLVLSAAGDDTGLPAIRKLLDTIGVPYDVQIAKDQRLTAERLCSVANGQGQAHYQGVLLATGDLAYEVSPGVWGSALSDDEWQLLWSFERKYSVRQAAMYTYPGSYPESYGLAAPEPLWGSDTGPDGLPTTLTAAGAQVFGDLQPTAVVPWRYTWAYQAKPTTATALMVDAAGNALVASNNSGDGRQTLVVTADNAEWLLHTQVIGYGVVNWLTKGVHMGQRRVYLSAQPDDIVMADSIWDEITHSDGTGKTYRITANDYQRYSDWQRQRNRAGTGRLITEMPFNGIGATAEYTGSYFPLDHDDLTPAIAARNSTFTWLSHTFEHPNLDAMTYEGMTHQLRRNDEVARSELKLGRNYSATALVTPEISGLNNAEAMRAVYDFGIRHLVSDTSKYCGHRDQAHADAQGCPKPNRGIWHDLTPPGLLMIPRYPTNLFYNVSTPAEWADEYNTIYRSYWGRDLSYAEIQDIEADQWLRYMVSYDMRPLMFHQPNMRAHDGTHSLLGELIDRAMAKYQALYKLPVTSRTQDQIGQAMKLQMALDAALAPQRGAPLAARIEPQGSTARIVIDNPTRRAVQVPLSGVAFGHRSEVYGGQPQSLVPVAAGGSVRIDGVTGW